MPVADCSLPRGVADYLQHRTSTIAAIERKVLEVAESWGFQRVMPPALEFEDVLAAGMGEGLRSKTFRFDDWQSGRMLVIPSDITPQIARIVATRMSSMLFPHRICYAGRVLRHAEQQSGRSREIMQAGVELIGLESPEADAEMVAMAVEIMYGLGLHEFTVDLGQVAFCRGVFAASGLRGTALLAMQDAIAHKDVSSVSALLASSSVSAGSRSELLALPRLFGSCAVLDEASKVVCNEQSSKALHNLRAVVDILKLHGIDECLSIDLGETRGLDYHTGLTFEGFVPGIGEALFSGGRYDDLTAGYGVQAPATGFTCNILTLLQALENAGLASTGCKRDLLLFNQRGDRHEALILAKQLRQQGYCVARDIIRRELSSSLEYAAQTGTSGVLVLGEEEGSYLLIRVSDRRQWTINNEQLQQKDFLRQHDLFRE